MRRETDPRAGTGSERKLEIPERCSPMSSDREASREKNERLSPQREGKTLQPDGKTVVDAYGMFLHPRIEHGPVFHEFASQPSHNVRGQLGGPGRAQREITVNPEADRSMCAGGAVDDLDHVVGTGHCTIGRKADGMLKFATCRTVGRGGEEGEKRPHRRPGQDKIHAALAHLLSPSSGESVRSRDSEARPRHHKILNSEPV